MRIVAQRQLMFDGQNLKPGDTVAYQDTGRPVAGRVLRNLVGRGMVGFVETETGTVPVARRRAKETEDA